MAVIEGLNTIDGALNTLRTAGAPVAGVSAIQSVALTGTPTGGTFTLSYGGVTTSALAFNCAASDVLAALTALPTIGAGNVTTAGGPEPGAAITVTFAAALAVKNVALFGANGALLTGGTTPAVVITYATTGVDATFRGASRGQMLQDTTNAAFYENTGNPGAPVWTAH